MWLNCPSFLLAHGEQVVYLMTPWCFGIPVGIAAIALAKRGQNARNATSRSMGQMLAWLAILIPLVLLGLVVYLDATSSFKYAAQFSWVGVLAKTGSMLIIGIAPPVTLGIAALIISTYKPTQARSIECQKCGYNLTGLTEPRCPECFTPFDPAQLPKNP